ncbi:hypothetical protein [Bacillus wiedmannii]|uniref:Ricin B lectin domain-containing protein n=1 Tax=Bacillus wiedmannii TaxID=1890302 RepID=A0A2C5P9S9_9BACI|nr:hypothetical protein [Bacillus wiedmannii]PHG56634.1 hypothetical protein COI65_25315 [Bacillus wiedmannii]
MKRRNILQHVFLGLGILASASIMGLNLANADTLKDINGNPVEYNKSYYLEPKDYPGKGITHASWHLGSQWAYLDPNTRGLPIKIKPAISNNDVHVFENRLINIQMQTTNLNHSYLRVSKNYNGIQLSQSSLELGAWRTQNLSNSRFVTFKNAYSNKYLNHQGINAWLDATKSEQTVDTQWKLVPKN